MPATTACTYTFSSRNNWSQSVLTVSLRLLLLQAQGSMATKRAAAQHTLMDLDDACLMRIFKHLMPLPDLFQVAQTCWVSNVLQLLCQLQPLPCTAVGSQLVMHGVDAAAAGGTCSWTTRSA